MDFTLGLELLGVSFLAALLALATLALFQQRSRGAKTSVFIDAPAGTVFLFDDECLIDASDDARALLATSRATGGPWLRFMAYAGPRFPDLANRLVHLPELGRVSITAPGVDQLTLIAEWRSGLRKITLVDVHADGRLPQHDALAQRAQDEELSVLRQVTDTLAFPIWREAADGTLTWANHAYVVAAAKASGGEGVLSWPLPRLFEVPAAASQRRLLAKGHGGAPDHWFDCHSVSVPDARILAALPADSTVQAEEALRGFVQTLTKTFAHLPIGLAIFDRHRKLQLFNPALTDLTSLPADFLSGRPGFFAFLDAMRDRQMIPEPKDYKGWRAQMAALERSAAAGQYEETWSLPSGLTYRVMGRPHPEGALALLFQDISDEISRARRFRADQELGQAVIDAMEEAVTVFSQAGLMVMSNAAYADMWQHDPGATLGDPDIAKITDHWRELTAPSPIWALIESFVASGGARDSWQAEVRMPDGRQLRCRVVPLAGGATLVGFRGEPGAASELQQMAGKPALVLAAVGGQG
ncbi:MAG: PAS-domain containing protein [Gemmobacter sp.]|nr:PAS-domain containing protein [Gemmobacter sp.]